MKIILFLLLLINHPAFQAPLQRRGIATVLEKLRGHSPLLEGCPQDGVFYTIIPICLIPTNNVNIKTVMLSILNFPIGWCLTYRDLKIHLFPRRYKIKEQPCRTYITCRQLTEKCQWRINKVSFSIFCVQCRSFQRLLSGIIHFK
ncbi:hypothetical protein EV200_101140 [Pedobacter psychrotolerans]|uniref:Secreted protein n=1 Tax=Pedobacter psychrotolerans TaxID=1843235 RepID=A0A4R2HLV9_9SPHI|nr:hypothetical protein EV200_101140 [Pedobacter psychrotolerans]